VNLVLQKFEAPGNHSPWWQQTIPRHKTRHIYLFSVDVQICIKYLRYKLLSDLTQHIGTKNIQKEVQRHQDDVSTRSSGCRASKYRGG